MKTKFKFFMAAAILAVGFSSCSNDDDGPSSIAGGKDTKLKISIPAPKTYADNNAIGSESSFKTAHVFVYNGGSLETSKDFVAADFTPNGDKYLLTDPMDVKTGAKNIYVGLNLSTEDIAAVKAGLHASYVTTVANIAKTDEFSMFSMNKDGNNRFVLEEKTGDASNTVDVTVERWAAKINALVSSTINTEAAGAKIGSFKFAMGGVNMKMFPFQKLGANGVVEDPNWNLTDDAIKAGIIGKEITNEFGDNTTIDEAAFVAVDAEGTAVADRTNKYVLENTSSYPRKGEMTYSCVRAEFTAKAFHSYNVDELVITENTGNEVPAELFVVEKDTGETFYFKVKADAEKYAADNKLTVSTYKNGICYYYVYLDGKKSDVGEGKYNAQRNYMYVQSITKVNSLGYPDPYPIDPEKPLSKDTKLTVNVDINPWILVPSNEELGKI